MGLLNSSDRQICLFGEMDIDSFTTFYNEFKELMKSQEEITVVINSEGGKEEIAFAIYDLLRYSPNRITTICLGEASSMAALVFQAGIKRIMTPNSRFMMHWGQWEMESKHMQQRTMVNLGRESLKTTMHYADLLSKHSFQSLDLVLKWMDDEKVFTAQEAVEHGFADEVSNELY